jgi:hypothetical protein
MNRVRHYAPIIGCRWHSSKRSANLRILAGNRSVAQAAMGAGAGLTRNMLARILGSMTQTDSNGFNFKIGGVSAEYYVVLFCILFIIYLVLPLPASYYAGDIFYVVAFVILLAVSAVSSFVTRLVRRLRGPR